MSHEFHLLTIGNISKETPDTVTLHLNVPESLEEKFRFRSGQFLTLRFMLKGKEERRSYSICTAPFESKLSITVKRVMGGLVSTYILENLKAGDTIEVMAPEGKFVLNSDFNIGKSYYFVAAGSGITPVISHIKTLLEDEPQSSLFLLYGNRNEQSIIFRQQLDSLQKFYSGQLYIEYVLSQPKREKPSGLGGFFSKGTISWQGKTGRINAKMLEEFMSDYPPRHKVSEYVLCGPGQMIDDVTSFLKRLDIDKKHIHAEYFTTDTTPDHISDKSSVEATLIAKLNGNVIETSLPAGKTILDQLIDMKKDPPYSCRAGSCSTCMAKVISGTVEMKVCHALTDEEIEEGYILTCQSLATSANVEVDYDV